MANIQALANVEDLTNGENSGYSCTVTLRCCGILDNVTVSCTGREDCKILRDLYNYACRGVRCDGKETLCK